MAANRAHALVTDVRNNATGSAIVVFKVAYNHNFNLDQQEVIVDLTKTIGNINNAIQQAAMDVINKPEPDGVGAGTIANKNDVRLASGFVS